jgi:hypothetical protein
MYKMIWESLPELSNGAIQMLYKAMSAVTLAERTEEADWRKESDALEAELSARHIQFIPLNW